MQNFDPQVIVIGAGIAGLTAAWQLKQNGIQTVVLEAEQSVGGRMKSLQVDDAIIDYGAQFLSSAYSVIPKLIKEMRLDNEYIATNEWVGLIKNNRIALIHPQKPWSLVSSQLLSPWNLICLIFRQFKLINFKRKSFALNDITDWLHYDGQLASEWVRQNFGEVIKDELTSAIFNGFYFQSINNSSAAMAAPILAFPAYHPKTMTLKSGIGSLPQKLAGKLAVKTNITVSALSETSSDIKIISDSGEFKAKHVIVTVPAPIAKNIIKDPDAAMSSLLKTQYSSTITIALLTHNNWSPPANIASAYGFLFNPNSNEKIAALTIENNKCASRKKSGYLINVMLTDKWTKDFMHLTDETIYAEIQAELEKVLPCIYAHVYAKELFRWPYAMPYTPIGRAKTVNDYRTTRNSSNRVWLAGDYLGLPWSDSAAQTGLWAAELVQKYL